MILGAVIKRLREQRGLSQRELAKRLRVTNPTISRWETGEVPCNEEWKAPLARAFQVPLEALEPARGDHDAPQPLITGRLPLYGDVPAGMRDTWPLPEESVEVLADLVKPTRFVLRVNGDSMEPDLRAGDLVVVDPVSPTIESTLGLTLDDMRTKGPIFVVRYNGQPTIKRIAFGATRPRPTGKEKVPLGFLLVCRNPQYEPIVVRPGDVIDLVGRILAVAWRSV